MYQDVSYEGIAGDRTEDMNEKGRKMIVEQTATKNNTCRDSRQSGDLEKPEKSQKHAQYRPRTQVFFNSLYQGKWIEGG